ncbi:hypothetical protein AMECASPLE_004422 [Ameca splendens]|uniref:Uncharacterized protein n=1 Tax=Ameca splendens TaxID=208324 RepID=A0ABV0XMX1_9TELE
MLSSYNNKLKCVLLRFDPADQHKVLHNCEAKGKDSFFFTNKNIKGNQFLFSPLYSYTLNKIQSNQLPSEVSKKEPGHDWTNNIIENKEGTREVWDTFDETFQAE